MIGQCLLGSVAFLHALGFVRSPAVRAPEPIPFQLTHLALDLTVDYGRGAVDGSAALTVRNVSRRASGRLPLVLNRLMRVSRVTTAAGAPVPFTQGVALFADDSSRQVNAITVAPVRPVAPGDSVTVVVHYGGVLVGYVETGSLYIKDHVSEEFTILREDAYAFPMIGALSESANRAAPRGSFGFTATIAVPSRQVVAMGGEGTRQARGDSLVRWSYHSTAPVPFLNITIAPYRMIERPGARIYHFAADSSGALAVASAITDAMAQYAAWYGALGAGPDLVVMEIPEGFGSQASLSAGIMQTADAFRNSGARRQLYHELSHLWNVQDLERPSPRWNEGLASFLEYRMAAQRDGWNGWSGVLDWSVTRLLRGCAAPTRCDTIPLASYGRAGMTDLSYSVGMLMFYALYEAMGARDFDRAYHDYVARYMRTGGTTAEMAAAFRAASPKSDAVFGDWLESTRWYARLQRGETLGKIVDSYR